MNEDVLKQLLEELLGSVDENAPIEHGASLETLELNKQVIELVINAGLMSLTQRPVTDELIKQATRSVAALRVTVKKSPEVLALKVKNMIFADWILPRMCSLLSRLDNEELRLDVVTTLGSVVGMWTSANPRSLNELRKWTESIKSYVTSKSKWSDRLIVVILLDMSKDEYLSKASPNAFSISFPTKDAFDLKVGTPLQAFKLAHSLLHLLSLILESRDTQWLSEKLIQLEGQLKKWSWNDAIQAAKPILHASSLYPVCLLLQRCRDRPTQQTVVFRTLLEWTRTVLTASELKGELLPLERALISIIDAIDQPDSLQSIFLTTNLADALRNFKSSHRQISPKIAESVDALIQLSSQATRENQLKEHFPNKRRQIESSTTIDGLFRHLLSTVGVTRIHSHDHVTQLNSIISERWDTLTDVAQIAFVQGLGLLACAASGKLKGHVDHSSLSTFKCLICDGVEDPILSKQPLAFSLYEPIHALLQKKLTSQVRLSAITAFARIITHDMSSNLLSLSKSSVAQSIINLLSSETREQRIAVTQSLPLFFRDREVPMLSDIITENRVIIFRHLKKLHASGTHEKPLLETTVMAYSEIGKVATQNDLSFVLGTLVDFLGHKNSFIAALAYREILAIATAHNLSTWQLFSPFWSSISVKIIEQMKSRPQILQRMSEILEIRDSVFLTRTQHFTVPSLVLDRQGDVLEQISRKMGVRVWEILKENMSYILAVLFTQDNQKTANSIEFLVNLMSANKSSGSKPSIDTRSLIFSCRTPLTVELLKMLGSESDAKRERVFHALQTVAIYVSEKPPQDIRGTRGQEFLKAYLQNNMLELMNYFTDIITDKKGRKTFTEKIGCIAGIQEIIRFAAAASKSALPQIIACFQSALEDDLLRWSAIQAWGTLVEKVPSTEVVAMLAHMFAVFVQIWPRCSVREHDMIKLVIQDAITLHAHVIMSDYSLPSLSSIPDLQSFATDIEAWKGKAHPRLMLETLIRRCGHETAVICHRGLVELRDYLEKQEIYVHSLILGENCDKIITQLLRCLLDIAAKYHDTDAAILQLAVECLGLIGAVDPSRTDAAKEVTELTLQNNFEDAQESIAFAMTLIENRLVGCFRAATDTKAQAYLAWAMQELLVFCGFTSQILDAAKGLGTDQLMMRKWQRFSKAARETLTPLLTSKYSITVIPPVPSTAYPIFRNQPTYRDWLQTFTLATLHEAQGDNARKIFTTICSRIIKDQDLAIANFILPYAVLNVIISGTDSHRENIRQEFLAVLESSGNATSEQDASKSRLANQSVFLFVDYLQKWLRVRRKQIMDLKISLAKKANRYMTVDEGVEVDPAIARIEGVLSALPPDLMANASFQCGSYARALFHWEQYIRDSEKEPPEEGMDALYAKWQEIYTHLDEPDGIEGISAKLKLQTFEQQILEHENAGHWSAAQSCFELALQQDPDDLNLQKRFLNCIKQSGHHETYLAQISGLTASYPQNLEIYANLAIESSWRVGNWTLLGKFLSDANGSGFDYQIGNALLALLNGNDTQFEISISNLRSTLGHAIVAAGTDSSRQCYDALAKLHAVQELKAIRRNMKVEMTDRRNFMTLLDERLSLMMPTAKYQQFTLALRRAAIALSSPGHSADREIAAIWLSSAKIARKAGQYDEAYSAILRATELDLQPARLEQARWWWHQGQSRRAIESLQNSFAANVFEFNRNSVSTDSSNLSLDQVATNSHNFMLGKAMALLAKWLDSAKQTSEEDLLARYKKVQTICEKWEKSHYLLGHYYNRILEHEEGKPDNRQRDTYLNGDLIKNVCLCYLRSLNYGHKYLYETLPRIFTLWLDFGANVEHVATKEDRARVGAVRIQRLTSINDHLDKFIKKLPVYVFLPALAQLLSRVMHTNEAVLKVLIKIIVAILGEYPEQTMWSLIAVIKSNTVNRSYRGQEILAKLRGSGSRSREEVMKIASSAIRLSEALLKLCNFEITGRQTTASLSKSLNFPTHSVLPCPLVVPLQSNLTVILPPANTPKGKKHNPFPMDQPTLFTFEDEVEIMNSMQKPRKITVRGSDGVKYPFLVKPKDDLRKDARLMEFNSIINKLLKKNAESSRRQLYIRTYAVVPLNEEHGVVEWVPHTKVMRDIILRYLRQRGIVHNYPEIKAILDSTSTDPTPAELFVTELLPKYPPVLWEWFLEEFPGPTAWLESRTKFSRTLAVMSFVGYVLGLGDRHAENILLDATSGAAVHVDFNCLFEKGQSFEKPERVPFRLTQNLVDAMGPTGYEGVYRKAGEVTMRLLRANSDTLMSVLESFIHDPLVEWNRRKFLKTDKMGPDGENDEGRRALLTIKGKLGGQINKEELPLSAEGQVDELIRMAVSPARLVAMYVGWAAFL